MNKIEENCKEVTQDSPDRSHGLRCRRPKKLNILEFLWFHVRLCKKDAVSKRESGERDRKTANAMVVS